MVQLSTLVEALDAHLEAASYRDAAQNGLQVEGRPEVRRLALGVSASLRLFERAAEGGADAVLTHHGLFWSQPVTVVGPLAGRLRALLRGELSLLAYHIPLDAHPVEGNNACLARAIGLVESEPWGDHHGRPIGRLGAPAPGTSLEALAEAVGRACGAPPLLLGARPSAIGRVAICSGGGGSMLGQAVAAGADAFVTGEPGEPAQELAREAGMAVLGAGHYNTERLGLLALAGWIEAELGLETEFVELPNPV